MVPNPKSRREGYRKDIFNLKKMLKVCWRYEKNWWWPPWVRVHVTQENWARPRVPPDPSFFRLWAENIPILASGPIMGILPPPSHETTLPRDRGRASASKSSLLLAHWEIGHYWPKFTKSLSKKLSSLLRWSQMVAKLFLLSRDSNLILDSMVGRGDG